MSSPSSPSIEAHVRTLSIRKLKAALDAHNISYKHVLEKSELQDLLITALTTTTSSTSSSSSPSSSSPTADSSLAPSPYVVQSFAVGRLQCNMVLIADRETRVGVCVDPGGEAVRILGAIEELRMHVAEILVSHAHVDHFFAAHELQRALVKTQQVRDSDSNEKPLIRLHADDLFLWKAVQLQCMMLGLQPPAEELPEPDGQLRDGDTIEHLNGRVIHTPGHTPGSVCFHFPDDKLLLSGDTIFQLSVGRTDLPGGNGAQLVESIKSKLFTLDDETRVIPGHGPETVLGREKKFNPIVGSNSSL